MLSALGKHRARRLRHLWQVVLFTTGLCGVLNFLVGRHMVNVAEANRLVQRFQLDWNLQLPGDQQTPWKLAARWVSPTHVYPEHTPEMGAVLRSMATAQIVKATVPDIGGSNFKLMFTLAGGQRVLFKPKWYPRDHVHHIETLCQLRDSHIGEIIGFHLSRILGFRKTPLAVGRTLDIHKDIAPVASPDLLQLISNKRGRPCLRELCTSDGRVEGGLVMWLPEHVTFQGYRHPWGRMCPAIKFHIYHLIYRVNSTEDVCRVAQNWGPLRNKPALFLSMVDAAVLQYLIQSSDRKLDVGTGGYTDFMPVIDNAKSFADPNADFEEILAPLFHCCRVRESTYRRLQSFQNGTLSYVLDVLTQRDPVYPLLTSDHLQALDRRLHKVLAHIHLCICKHGRHKVLLHL